MCTSAKPKKEGVVYQAFPEMDKLHGFGSLRSFASIINNGVQRWFKVNWKKTYSLALFKKRTGFCNFQRIKKKYVLVHTEKRSEKIKKWKLIKKNRNFRNLYNSFQMKPLCHLSMSISFGEDFRKVHFKLPYLYAFHFLWVV